MSRTLAFLLLAIVLLVMGFLSPLHADAQVMKKAEILPAGNFSISGSPTVFMDDGTNEIALFVYGLYGLTNNTNIRGKVGFFEADNYYGANFEWALRRVSPMLTFSLGGHHAKDPAVDLTINLTAPLSRDVSIYGGFDADLVFDDDPDLPLWVFMGFSYHLLNRVDMMIEFNYGFVEVAPQVLASGFVFHF